MRLLLDVMCGKLAVYLRFCGHDAAYALDRGVEDDDAILAWAREEGRTLVTRDAERAGDAVLVCATAPVDQLRELRAAGVDLTPADRPTRCGRCNGVLERVAEDAGAPSYAPDPAETAVWRCADCGQRFWRGSHWDDVRETLAGL
jgi:uncharacterized protein with PIN domain